MALPVRGRAQGILDSQVFWADAQIHGGEQPGDEGDASVPAPTGNGLRRLC